MQRQNYELVNKKSVELKLVNWTSVVSLLFLSQNKYISPISDNQLISNLTEYRKKIKNANIHDTK
jgi:hypothetical protein